MNRDQPTRIQDCQPNELALVVFSRVLRATPAEMTALFRACLRMQRIGRSEMRLPLRLCCSYLLLAVHAAALQLPPRLSGVDRPSGIARQSSTRGAFVRDALAAAGLLALRTPGPAFAAEEDTKSVPDRIIGEIPASGLVFRDYLKVSRFDDPKVQGVQLYVSDFQLPMTERLASGDPFSDPASTAVTCVKTGPIKLDPTVETSSQGEEVFSQARSLLFKSVKARRHRCQKQAILLAVPPLAVVGVVEFVWRLEAAFQI